MDKTVVLTPRLSEKSYGLSQVARTYVFDVPKGMTKQSVAKAVAAQFEVTVTSVNLTNIAGKAKRTITKRRQAKGRDAAVRKAYVTVSKGQSLPIFAAIEEEETKQEALQEKVDKAAAKAIEKEAKKTDKTAKAEKPAAKKGLLGRKKTAKEDK